MRSSRSPFLVTGLATALALAVAACKPATAPEQAAQPDANVAPADSAAATAGSKSGTAFDIASLPVSTATLGAFPYLGLPQGYRAGMPTTRKFERVPYWTGDRVEWVEGQVHAAMITPLQEQPYSPLELAQNIEALVTQLGGSKIFSGQIPSDATSVIGNSPAAVNLVDGIGDIYNNPSDTFVIHRADRDIWIHLASSGNAGNLLVTETKPMQITAKLLPASDIGKALDTSGKIALQVQFATDKATLLPESKPQLDQVATLLKDAPGLRVGVHGHTDNSGGTQHNQQLSEQRAAAVVDYLASAGIDRQRLQSKGFGDTQPVAGNDTEDGKARNRRVELIKL